MPENKQIIITISREFGSLGHRIAEKLGEELGIPVVDKKLLYKMAEDHGFDPEFLKRYDEKPVNSLTSGEIRGHSNSLEKILCEMIFDYQKELIATEESYIFIGRGASWNLREHENLISIFIRADEDARIDHIAKSRDLTEKEAQSLMHKMDRRRKHFNHSNGNKHWGELGSYDLVIDSSELGVEGSVELIKKYIELWKEKSENWYD